MTFGNDDNNDGDGENHVPGPEDSSSSSDEFDVDMTPEPALSGEAEVECLGHYESMEAFLRSQVELLVIADGLWLLDCIDYDRVHGLLEGDEYRIWRDDNGEVFRRRLWSDPPAV